MKLMYNIHRQRKDLFYVRGFKAEERMFDIYVVDRWGNSSDTLYNVLNSFTRKPD